MEMAFIPIPTVITWIHELVQIHITVPGDFDIWVTKKNIDSHLQSVKMGFEKIIAHGFGVRNWIERET